jgi:hypothetical protein
VSVRHFIQVCAGGLELEVAAGPFNSIEARDSAARELRRKLDPVEDGIFWLAIDADGIATSGSFSGPGSLDPEYTIAAEIHSDNRLYEVRFEAVQWFKKASDQDILDIAEVDWGNKKTNWGCQSTAEIALSAKKKNPEIAVLLEYTSQTQDTWCPQGYECTVDGDDAMAWLKVKRPALHARIEAEMKSGV